MPIGARQFWSVPAGRPNRSAGTARPGPLHDHREPARHAAQTKRSTSRSALDMATTKPAAEKATAAKTTRQPSAAFMKPLTPSAQLAAVVGSTPLPRTEVVKKLWDYIKQHKLQDTANKRMINADAKLKPVFGKDQVSMFEMTKLVSQHLK
ncbi:MAG: SWIB/MDM2 domain-containing protein [Thiomonas sp.]